MSAVIAEPQQTDAQLRMQPVVQPEAQPVEPLPEPSMPAFGATAAGAPGMAAAPAASTRREQKRAFESNKLEKRLLRLTGQAIVDFNMIENGDRVMVCLSGGKDSYSMLEILLLLRQRAPIDFEIIVVNLDQKQPGFPAHILPEYLSARGVPFHIENQDTYSIVKRLIPEGKTTCSLCSRLRRGILYRVAGELGATKIALGHHRDDILETVFLNMFFGGKLKGMPPKLMSDDGKNIIIRPLAYIKEEDLTRYAGEKQFPIIPCDLCGSQENLKRKEIKGMLRDWEKKYPGRVESIFTSFANITTSHLMDRGLHPFTTLKATGRQDANGDIAFDEEPCAPVESDVATISFQRLMRSETE